jgi:NADH dehydrogenase
MGKRVVTLTGHPENNPFGDRVTAVPFSFDDPDRLAQSIEGATTFYNTYWVRFPYGEINFERAVENSKTLMKAAKMAGVRRFVHISITNAAQGRDLPYFGGKTLVEEALMESGLSYAIVRPTLVFGPGDILINNIAWMIRRFPAFAVIGSGGYRVRPVYVDDEAKIAVDAGHEDKDIIVDAVGPETYAFDELVRLIAQRIGRPARIVHVPPLVAFMCSKMIGYLVRDVVLIWDEVVGIQANLLVVNGPATGETRLSDWLDKNADSVGIRYASELKRHYI